MHLFLRKVFEKEHLLIHSWKNHGSDPPNSGASKCICGVGCVAQWLSGKFTLAVSSSCGRKKSENPQHFRWVWPSLGWWKRDPFKAWLVTSNDPVMKKGHELNHLALFQHDFLLGRSFPWVFCWMEVGNLSQRRCYHDESRRGSGHARVEPETSLGKESFAVKSRMEDLNMTTRLPKR